MNNFYIVDDRLPNQLKEIFRITTLIIGGTAALGQASIIKMLFEL